MQTLLADHDAGDSADLIGIEPIGKRWTDFFWIFFQALFHIRSRTRSQ